MEEERKQIVELSIKQFNSLPKTGKPKENEWTVLSSIVKEQNNQFEVVSLGTGSKCIGKSKMCPKGILINDSHAEVMCRRAFLRYLYDQLRNNSIVFIFDKQRGKFLLKPNIRFHFFTTHVPCGDAAIFPKEISDDVGDIISTERQDWWEVPTKKRKVDNIFRTGAKCLERDIKQDLKYAEINCQVLGAVRTKPGKGDPTASVSCSDKLAKWCHLGLQGALLMLILEKPIYLSSFTILNDTAFSPKALERALFKRLENVELIEPYARNILEVHTAAHPFTYGNKGDKRPCPSAIAWFQSNQDITLEVAVNGRKLGVTKANYYRECGRLKICKLELFKMFIRKLNEFNMHLNMDRSVEKLTYRKAKELSKDYQKNWKILQNKFGVWTSKEPALTEFLAVSS